jgi:hypothetical protein
VKRRKQMEMRKMEKKRRQKGKTRNEENIKDSEDKLK